MRRGHSILLVLLALTAGVVGSALVHQRASFSILSTQADEVRSTALWLGRSALVNAPAGATRVPTDVGEAVVVRSGGRVTVELAGHRAELDGAPYRERYR
ncbi:hypothetical protein LBMAG42_09040 [Deltaproteobacteria bacterium]|nr:hypothetical protein LBMAG42_09040 [Deltaproteobacteria bacterium]